MNGKLKGELDNNNSSSSMTISRFSLGNTNINHTDTEFPQTLLGTQGCPEHAEITCREYDRGEEWKTKSKKKKEGQEEKADV